MWSYENCRILSNESEVNTVSDPVIQPG